MAFRNRVRTVSLCTIVVVASAWACTADDPPTPIQTTPAQASPAENTCTEPRGQMCPMIYMPVCVVNADGSQKTYPNSCIACRDTSVTHYKKGKCANAQ